MVDHNKLTYYREVKGLAISSVARKIKRSKKNIEEWENGNKEIEEKDLIKLAKLYEVDITDFYFKEETKTKVLIPLIILFGIIGIVCGLIIKNYFLMVLIPIININAYVSFVLLKNKCELTKDNDVPKSLFNYLLPNDSFKKRLGIYLSECNIFASFYLIFCSLCELLKIKLFIINIEIISQTQVNKFIIFILVYLLLFVLAFIIELVFGEYMIKNYKGDKNE